MIFMCPPVRLGKTAEERDAFLRKVGVLNVQTVSMATPADWADSDVESARDFLEAHEIRIGEFSAFHKRFASDDLEVYREAQEHYRRQLHHAHILNAHCVGFAIICDRATPQMWSEATWHRCIDAVKELVEAAEAAQMDVAAHPHIISPLCSLERYRELLDAVNSPRLKVLMDPVNLTWPQMVYNTDDLINRIFDELADHIVAVHAKDLALSAVQRNGKHLSVVHVDEAVPGTGTLDYHTLLRRLDALDHNVSVHVEHFDQPDTIAGQEYIRYVARELGITLH